MNIDRNDSPVHAQTVAAIEAQQAYFEARARGVSRAERERLERNWLSAARRLRIGTAQ